MASDTASGLSKCGGKSRGKHTAANSQHFTAEPASCGDPQTSGLAFNGLNANPPPVGWLAHRSRPAEEMLHLLLRLLL